MSAAARAAVPAVPHCLPPRLRAPARRCSARACVRAVALRVFALSGDTPRRKRSVREASAERQRRGTPSLDVFLAEQGGSGALLGFAVVHDESDKRLGTVREVLTVAGGEVVFKASGDGGAATDEELLSALAGFGDWADTSAPSSAESTLLRVEGAGYVLAGCLGRFLALNARLLPQARVRLGVLPPLGNGPGARRGRAQAPAARAAAGRLARRGRRGATA